MVWKIKTAIILSTLCLALGCTLQQSSHSKKESQVSKKGSLPVWSTPSTEGTQPGADSELASLGQTKMKSNYWKEWPQFHFHIDEKSPRYTIKRIGPVGLGLDLLQPAFTMRIMKIEDGSPAAATGKLKVGQFIESINGKTIKDNDPRVILGNIITEAEAIDGKLKLMIKDKKNSKAYPVTVQIPVMGEYSESWPLNCKKSDKIIRNFADFLKRSGKAGYGAALFLLSTGEQKDLDVVTSWFKNKLPKDMKGYPWDIGYNGPAICEYYLRTGDESVLPAIASMANQLKKTIYNGGWAGRGGAPFRYMAGGHMNAAGVHCLTFLLLAKECGVEVDEHTLQSALYQFFRFSGHGNVAYGDGTPEGGMVDNGRTGGLAFAMAAAASLSPEGESSVYAKARDINANKSFYSTSWLAHGHTGGGIGEVWRGSAFGLLAEKRPEQYKSFMKDRRWLYELSRCNDGAFGITYGSINASYDTTGHNGGRSWGNIMAMIYTIPRKNLRIHGAPKSPYSKSYALPKRPWGSAADDAFYSLQPGIYRGNKIQNVDRERLKTDASWPLMRKIGDPKASDEVLIMFAHHPEQAIRASSARAINRLGKDHLIVELLKSKDPRGRHTGAHTIAGQFKGKALPVERLTDEMAILLANMISDPNEAWWCAYDAMLAISRARKDLIIPCFNSLESWLKSKDWWMRKAAMTALTPLVADEKYYKKILPIVGNMISTNQRSVALSSVSGMVRQLQNATPQVKSYAIEIFGEAYENFPKALSAPGGQNMSDGLKQLITGIASSLGAQDGGLDKLYEVSSKRFKGVKLPHQEIFLAANPDKMGPELKNSIKPILVENIIPAYIGVHKVRLLDQLKKRQPGREVDALVDLQRKAGVNDYDWKAWGPSRNEIKWEYHSFDPVETKLWESKKRYRKVSWPKGMENWFSADFDAMKSGWKKGYGAFAHNDGKLSTRGGCIENFCGCGEEPKSYWEKEVLMMRAEIELPPIRDGYAYRLLVGGRSHSTASDGSDVWFDGDYVSNRRPSDASLPAAGKRHAHRPWGVMIDNKFRKHFKDGKVLLACTGFLSWKKRTSFKYNYQSFWFEEMKLPEITKEDLIKSATVTPMNCTAYYETMSENDKFSWNGEFQMKKNLKGNWKIIAQVKTIQDFKPKMKSTFNRSWLKKISLLEEGKTNDNMIIWSGDTLMNLNNNHALKMVSKYIEGTSYLFIEAGGYNHRTKQGFKPEYYVYIK